MTTKDAPNLLKYENYKEQFKRLNKAIHSNFYLEAMFIAYAIMEDRTESILSYEGNEINSDRFVSINRKLKRIKQLAERNNSLLARYFSDTLIDEILEWKEERNSLMHALMKQSLTTEDLEIVALKGKDLARKLANRATSYRRALERKSGR